MYSIHVVQVLVDFDKLGSTPSFEFTTGDISGSPVQGDFVVFPTSEGATYISRIADHTLSDTANDEYRIFVEPPVKINDKVQPVINSVRFYRGVSQEFNSVDDVVEFLGLRPLEKEDLDLEDDHWVKQDGEYQPTVSLPEEWPSDAPGGSGGGDGNGGDGDGGDGDDSNNNSPGEGIDQTGTLLSEQYSARDSIRQAAKGTSQVVIVLFGVVLAGLAVFDDAIPTEGLSRLWIPLILGVGFLLIALLGASFIITRTAANPRPGSERLTEAQEPESEETEDGFVDLKSGPDNSGEDFSETYYAQVEELRKQHEGLGGLIGMTVAVATLGAIMLFYGALMLGFKISILELIKHTPPWTDIDQFGIIIETIILLLFSGGIVLVATRRALPNNQEFYGNVKRELSKSESPTTDSVGPIEDNYVSKPFKQYQRYGALALDKVVRDDADSLEDYQTESLADLYLFNSKIYGESSSFHSSIKSEILERNDIDEKLETPNGVVTVKDSISESLKDDTTVIQKLQHEGINKDEIIKVEVDRNKVQDKLNSTSLDKSDLFDIKEKKKKVNRKEFKGDLLGDEGDKTEK